MNVCVVSTYEGTTHDYMDLWDTLEENRKKFVTDYDIGVVREGKIILMLNVTDMNRLQEAMTQPHVLEWDKKHNCVDVIYTLDKQS